MIEKVFENEKYYFIVRALNNQIITKSFPYESEASRDNGIESLKNIIQKEINR